MLIQIRLKDGKYLPVKLRRNTKLHRNRSNKKKRGCSIEERPAEINECQEFGHWEVDLVFRAKSGGDEALLTMLDRKNREYLMFLIPDKSAASVMDALKSSGKIIANVSVISLRLSLLITVQNLHFSLI